MTVLKPLDSNGQAIHISELPKDHNFTKAAELHAQGAAIIEALNRIEAFRIDALAKLKKALPETDEHSELAAALVVLNNKRAEGLKNYRAYLKTVESLLH